MSSLFCQFFYRIPQFPKVISTCRNRIPIRSTQNHNIGNYFQLCTYSSNPKPNIILRKRPKKPFISITWKAVLGAIVIGGSFTMYMFYLQEEKDLRIAKERKRQIGKAAIGGKFELINSEGKLVKSDDFLGKWMLLYFGFTHCPDICPEELEKLAKVANKLETQYKMDVQPIFISVDPARDTPQVVGQYTKEFSDKIIGLTGSLEQVAATCKVYRIYFSNGIPDSDNDYIVDHTILIYLIDPDGAFVDYYGQLHDADKIVSSIFLHKVKYDKIQNNEPAWKSITLKTLEVLKS